MGLEHSLGSMVCHTLLGFGMHIPACCAFCVCGQVCCHLLASYSSEGTPATSLYLLSAVNIAGWLMAQQHPA